MSTPVNEEQESAPRSGVAPTDVVGGVPFSNGTDIQGLVDQLGGLMEQAIADDHAEVEIARSCIPRTWYCTDGYDANKTMERFGGLEQLTRDKFATLQELVQPLVRTADVVEHNMTSPFSRWKAVAEELARIAEEVRSIVHVSQWEGEAADVYTADTFYQTDRAHALTDLARNAKGAVESVCIIQAALGSATADKIQGSINGAMKNLNRRPFDSENVRSQFSGMSRGEFFAHQFYVRTNIVNCAVQSAITGVESIGDKSQEWQKASQDIRDKLAAALAEAQRWKGSRAEYITHTDVNTADVCGTGFSEQDMHLQKGW